MSPHFFQKMFVMKCFVFLCCRRFACRRLSSHFFWFSIDKDQVVAGHAHLPLARCLVVLLFQSVSCSAISVPHVFLALRSSPGRVFVPSCACEFLGTHAFQQNTKKTKMKKKT